ncbi:nuclear respiratory factor 1 isoform X1 [Lates japonicus]
MEDHNVHQTEHMTTIEASAVSQQVQQVHVATFTETTRCSVSPHRVESKLTCSSQVGSDLIRTSRVEDVCVIIRIIIR